PGLSIHGNRVPVADGPGTVPPRPPAFIAQSATNSLSIPGITQYLVVALSPATQSRSSMQPQRRVSLPVPACTTRINGGPRLHAVIPLPPDRASPGRRSAPAVRHTPVEHASDA